MSKIIIDTTPIIRDLRDRLTAFRHEASVMPLEDVVFHEIECCFLGDNFRHMCDPQLSLFNICHTLRLTQEQKEDVITYAQNQLKWRVLALVEARDHLNPDGWTVDVVEGPIILIHPEWRHRIPLSRHHTTAGTTDGYESGDR